MWESSGSSSRCRPGSASFHPKRVSHTAGLGTVRGVSGRERSHTGRRLVKQQPRRCSDGAGARVDLAGKFPNYASLGPGGRASGALLCTAAGVEVLPPNTCGPPSAHSGWSTGAHRDAKTAQWHTGTPTHRHHTGMCLTPQACAPRSTRMASPTLGARGVRVSGRAAPVSSEAKRGVAGAFSLAGTVASRKGVLTPAPHACL